MPIRFCPLCDVLIDAWMNPDDGLANPEYPLNWLQEVRAIRTIYHLQDPFVTGVGWLDSDEFVVAPVEYECHYSHREPQPDLDDYFTAHQIDYGLGFANEHWCYVVHNACWELLRDRIDPDHKLPVNSLARHLFALLYNTPINVVNEALAPGHDYGHASVFHLRSGEQHSGYFTRVNASSYSFITGDVTEKFAPDEDSLEDDISSLCARLARVGVRHGNYSQSDPFYLLPSELVMFVLAYLPSRDACSLRLASKYVADLSTLELLDQRFWSTRFDPDFEMGFVFAGPSNPRPAGPSDWRSLYLKAKVALQSELFPGLRNRHRIWNIFKHISDAIYVRLENEPWIQSSPGHSALQLLPGKAVFAEASFEFSATYTDCPLTLSCRLFERQEISWSQFPDALPKRLRVSSVFSNGKSYISGLRLITTDDLDTAQPLRAGFVNSRQEHDVFLEPHSSIEKLEVAMSTKGIIGLRFYIRALQSSAVVLVGDMELTDPSSGISRLTPDENMQCVGFHLGLDACKIISISLMEQQARTLPSPINKRASQKLVQNVQPAEVWNPNIPEVHPSWHLPEPNPTQFFNLCLSMDFGGRDGQLLRSLVRIVIFMGKFPAVFIGIAFVYIDGSERFYGRKSFRNSIDETTSIPAVRQCFPIDGPHGEVVNRISISYFPKRDTIQAVTVATNFDRMKQFRLYGKESMGEDKDITQVLEAEPGTHFTAFYAKIQSPIGYFRDFSARCQAVSESPGECLPLSSEVAHDISITLDTLNSAQDILAYPRGFAFAAANLSRLRRIRISVDDETHPSLRRHITGLWLEYYDSSIPVILGQWVKELDTLDLLPEDRITEVVIWHDYTNRHKRVKYGPITKMRVQTLRGKVKEFLDPHIDGKVCLEYRENPYEQLSGILWGYNHEWDHVRVFYSSKTNGLRTLITEPARYICPTWAVIQKAFFQESRDHGPNPVTTIETSFREVSNEISGLTLIYEDEKCLTLGIRGKEGTRMSLSSDEELAQIEIGGNREHQIVLITFLTTSGRRIDLSKKKLESIQKRVYHRTVYNLDRSCPQPPNTLHNNPRPIPEMANAFVGFWALPKRSGSLRYGRFGPIFECVSCRLELEK
ncbi:hypothetical protein F5Y13DRAFT_204934 [Hypoxylon sp. FL1857]|nr:hypothetical protein F5Y13DRAFT_204934 [Hypoxylon sp. FL1857]